MPVVKLCVLLLDVSEVTQVLGRIGQGDPHAAERLLPLVYEELRKLAAARMFNESGTQTLQATALVHEAWLRLVSEGDRTWQNRAQFFAAAAEAMRRILIERARRKHALKRGADAERIDLDRVDIALEADVDTLLRVDEALEKLVAKDPQAAELVKLRFFVGMGTRRQRRRSESRNAPPSGAGASPGPGFSVNFPGRRRSDLMASNECLALFTLRLRIESGQPVSTAANKP